MTSHEFVRLLVELSAMLACALVMALATSLVAGPLMKWTLRISR